MSSPLYLVALYVVIPLTVIAWLFALVVLGFWIVALLIAKEGEDEEPERGQRVFSAGVVKGRRAGDRARARLLAGVAWQSIRHVSRAAGTQAARAFGPGLGYTVALAACVILMMVDLSPLSSFDAGQTVTRAQVTHSEADRYAWPKASELRIAQLLFRRERVKASQSQFSDFQSADFPTAWEGANHVSTVSDGRGAAKAAEHDGTVCCGDCETRFCLRAPVELDRVAYR